MQDAVLMRVVNGLGNFFEVGGGLSGRQQFFANQFGQVFAFDIIHREVMLPLMLPHLVNGHNVRMMQAGCRFGLGAEAFDELVAGEFAEQEHFHRHDPVQAHLARFVDDAHAPAGDFF